MRLEGHDWALDEGLRATLFGGEESQGFFYLPHDVGDLGSYALAVADGESLAGTLAELPRGSYAFCTTPDEFALVARTLMHNSQYVRNGTVAGVAIALDGQPDAEEMGRYLTLSTLFEGKGLVFYDRKVAEESGLKAALEAGKSLNDLTN